MITYRDLMHHRSSASRLAKYGDPVRIASKEVDVLLHPLQSHTLVQQTGISSAVGLQSRATKPTKGSQAVVHCHIDNLLPSGHSSTSGQQSGNASRSGFLTTSVAAAIDPYQNWRAVALASGFEHLLWHNDIQKQAILGRAWILWRELRGRIARPRGRSIVRNALEVGRNELLGDELPSRICLRTYPPDTPCLDPGPIHSRRLGGRETQLAQRRSSITNVGEVVELPG